MPYPPTILPAAGRSRRMGQPKLLLPYRERTVVGSAVDAFIRAGCSRLVLVVAPDDEALTAWCRDADVEWVINPEPERGMLSSIQCGLRSLGAATSSGVLVSPADLPALASSTVEAVVRHTNERPHSLIVPTTGGKRGHPLVVPAHLVPEIQDLDPEVGLRQLLDLHAERIVEIAVEDPGSVRDVDTPTDYADLLELP